MAYAQGCLAHLPKTARAILQMPPATVAAIEKLGADLAVTTFCSSGPALSLGVLCSHRARGHVRARSGRRNAAERPGQAKIKDASKCLDNFINC
jgi:hypothetical protein